jgi:protoporphyrinogen oxidase
LSESYCNNAEEFIVRNGGEITLSEPVENFLVKDNKVIGITTSQKTFTDFDFVISTIPAYALKRIVGEESKINFTEFTYSSILNIHIRLIKNVIPDGFFGIINSPLHWVFNKGTHLNIVISDADEFMIKSDEELMEMVIIEMKKYFLLNPEFISAYKIIKEKRATFIPSINVIDNRPSQKTSVKNLILAGDWVDTRLPSTIESAVKSGRLAAEMLINCS